MSASPMVDRIRGEELKAIQVKFEMLNSNWNIM